MKKFLTTTALGVVLVASSASAAMLSADTTYQTQPGDINASQFIGSRIYATENEVSTDTAMNAGDEKNWDDVGEVNDVIMNKDGEVEAVVIGVGGFIGIGEKDVAVSMKDLNFVSDGEDADDYFLVINANKQVLTDAPEYKAPENRQAMNDTGMTNETADANGTATDTTEMAATDRMTDRMDKDGKVAQETTAQDTSDNMAANDTQVAENDMMLKRPDVTVEGYGDTMPEDLTAEALQGATVYGSGDEDVGDVAELILGSDGKTVEKLVIDVGGFLGIGEHRIAVGVDQVNIQKNADGSEFRVYIDNNQEALEAMPEYEG
ncbi:PRC-barrel domain-containing protein [Rhizobium sp. L1K21]|uniref:PRC-barrel domain-containing protein n=1 Tax=Rhizobium sp. L1K21 TaxID=2954933 RepID=UPI002093795C|nr:PRC-barrel domain-containing protein [Rhizobium sp. L1K21]MCO6185859.1 PRC-barrel domain-containing protein [Rhizobium sp. L1K21]